jgi:hypothetical protein
MIGIVSDTHGRADAARKAARLLADRAVTRVIHCGDIGDAAVVDQFAQFETTYVWGNTDFDRGSLRRYIKSVGGAVGEPFARVQVDGRLIAATHGDDGPLLRRLIDAGRHDYVLHGHTHEPRDQRVGKTRVINPGALHRAREHTIALLDVSSDELEFVTVE